MRYFITIGVFALLFIAGCGGETNPGDGTPTNAPTLVAASANEGCRGGGMGIVPFAETPSFTTYVNGMEIEVVHADAAYNCCLLAIEKKISYDEATDTITLTEKEKLGMGACDCTCDFEVFWQVKLHKTGRFPIKVYGLDSEGGQTLLYETTLTVTGNEAQTFPEHETVVSPPKPEGWPAELPEPTWPTKVPLVKAKYLSDEEILAILGMEDATKEETEDGATYTSEKGTLQIENKSLGQKIDLFTTEESEGILVANDEEYNAVLAEYLADAQPLAEQLTSLGLLLLPRENDGEDSEGDSSTLMTPTYRYTVVSQGFPMSFFTLMIQIDKNHALHSLESWLPDTLETVGNSNAATKAEIRALIKEDVGVDEEPSPYRIMWYFNMPDMTTSTLWYLYQNPSTGGGKFYPLAK